MPFRELRTPLDIPAQTLIQFALRFFLVPCLITGGCYFSAGFGFLDFLLFQPQSQSF
jgi:hypothetical protein